MTSTPALSRSVAWTVSGTMVFALSQWAIVALIAKLAGAAALGRFTLAAAVVAPILAFTQLQLRAVLATDARFESRFKDYLQIRAWSVVVMIVATMIIAGLGGMDAATVGVLLAFVLAKSFDSMADVLYGYHQRREDMKVIAIGQFINGALSVGLFGALLYATEDLVIATVGYAAASALTLVLWAVPISILKRTQDTMDPRNQLPGWRQLLRSAMPLGIVMVLAGLAANLPRYAIQIDLGEAALGIFGGLAYIILVGTNVISAIGQAASPRLAKLAAARDSSRYGMLLTRLLVVSVAIAGTGVVIATVWGEAILERVYTPSFAEYTHVLVALAAAALFSFPAIILAVAATAARSFRAQLPVFLVVLAVGAVACYFLVPLWGLTGAALAIALMAVVQATGCAVLVRSAVWKRA